MLLPTTRSLRKPIEGDGRGEAEVEGREVVDALGFAIEAAVLRVELELIIGEGEARQRGSAQTRRGNGSVFWGEAVAAAASAAVIDDIVCAQWFKMVMILTLTLLMG